jgi:hypothetical protein
MGSGTRTDYGRFCCLSIKAAIFPKADGNVADFPLGCNPRLWLHGEPQLIESNERINNAFPVKLRAMMKTKRCLSFKQFS